MLGQKSQRSAEELVKKKYPNAFEDDDGEWVYIYAGIPVKSQCPCCRQVTTVSTLTTVDQMLGSGGDSSRAWDSAARSLGLIE